jgi:Tfp pilus assembly protein PilX
MKYQRGATLLVGLILLVLLTLFAITALNTGTANLKIVGNMQARNEAQAAAQDAIETVISSPLFTSDPANAVVNPCGAANTLCSGQNPDGSWEYTTQITPNPTCVAVTPIMESQLNFANADDVGCTQQQSQLFGIVGATNGQSLCANTVWEITAQTTGASTGATVTVTQGIGVRISTDEMATSCL